LIIDFAFGSKFSDKIEWDEERVKRLIQKIVKIEKKELGVIIYKFVSEKEIKDTNEKFLNHDYITDIIAFDNSFMDQLNGEILICLTKVEENSKIYSGGNEQNELLRVIIHGILHLCGYKDKSTDEQNEMRRKENIYLEMY
jgi:probable rRNA maturation factor